MVMTVVYDKQAQVEGQKRPTISFISGAGSGEVVTDLGKSAELICQVVMPNLTELGT